jgi:uncharacterized protein YbjQ (UPF0145 family)
VEPVIAPEAVVTLDRVDGFRIVRRLGSARGEVVRPPSLWRSLGRSIGALVGFAPLALRSDADCVRDECLQALLERASSLGANGVVALRFEAIEANDGSVALSAVGEAVVLEPGPPPS